MLGVIVILLFAIIFLILRSKGVDHKDIETALSSSWIKLGLDQKIGTIEGHARDIRDSYRSFDQFLRAPKERSSFGELSLETILSDQLPPDMYGIRVKTLDGKIPDGYIRSTVGTICIDCKFPLENYQKMIQSEDTEEKASYRKEFVRNVRGHLDKIAEDYVCPEAGSAEFAFAYIPSEAINYYLISEELEMLRDYTKKGVQVVSPLTLSHKIQLIKAGVHAKKLSEDADEVRKDLFSLSNQFAQIDDIWRVCRNHLGNLNGKSEELDVAYGRLRKEFSRISKLTED